MTFGTFLLYVFCILFIGWCLRRVMYHHKWDGTCCFCGRGTSIKIAKCGMYSGYEYYYYHWDCVVDVINNYDTYSSRDVDMALKIKHEIESSDSAKKKREERMKREFIETGRGE